MGQLTLGTGTLTAFPALPPISSKTPGNHCRQELADLAAQEDCFLLGQEPQPQDRSSLPPTGPPSLLLGTPAPSLPLWLPITSVFLSGPSVSLFAFSCLHQLPLPPPAKLSRPWPSCSFLYLNLLPPALLHLIPSLLFFSYRVISLHPPPLSCLPIRLSLPYSQSIFLSVSSCQSWHLGEVSKAQIEGGAKKSVIKINITLMQYFKN